MRQLVLTGIAVVLAAALTVDAADARRRHHRGSRAYAIERASPYVAERASAYDNRRGGAHAARRGSIAALVPPDWQLQPADPDWQGNRFVSPQGDAWLAFYARPADKTAHDQHLKAVAFVDGEELTYLRREPDWLVVSGFKGDRIFYRKVVLACGERSWRHIAFEYPAAAKRAFERLVTEVARALDQAADEDCDAIASGN
jgi:serine/threonine-protein kinase